ncbi:MAG TPA: DUF2752 domain-containing protein [Victivallales bacterium]|nr:DUF2752 domain-containing protein [Victivallales bacterium]
MILFNKENLKRNFTTVIIEHLILMLLSLTIIFASFFFDATILEKKEGIARFLPDCMFKKITGLPCPTCGMSRAFCCLSRGNFLSAFYYNPLSFILYPLILAGVILPFFSLIHLLYLKKKKKEPQ